MKAFHLGLNVAALTAAFARGLEQDVATGQTEVQEGFLTPEPAAESAMQVTYAGGAWKSRYSSNFVDERTSLNFAPCVQETEQFAPCGERAKLSSALNTRVVCNVSMCCSKKISVETNGKRETGNFCAPSTHDSCKGDDPADLSASVGLCGSCLNMAWGSRYGVPQCPPNSTCKQEVVNGKTHLYCKCNNGYVPLKEGKCVLPSQTTTTTTKPTTTTTTTTTRNPKEQCGVQDCRPGFCRKQDGKVRCSCLAGYIVKIGENGDTCVKQ